MHGSQDDRVVRMRQCNWKVVELHAGGYNRLGCTKTQSTMLNIERRSNIDYATQRYTE